MKKGTIQRSELKQETPAEMVDYFVRFIRQQFCPDIPQNEWFKRHRSFVVARVILWPAGFIVGKGFTVTPARYKEIMMEILKGVQQHGDTGNVGYWPAYLGKCVQSWWQKKWHLEYEKSKSMSNMMNLTVAAIGKIAPDTGARQIEGMATAGSLLRKRLNARKPVASEKKQLNLFGS